MDTKIITLLSALIFLSAVGFSQNNLDLQPKDSAYKITAYEQIEPLVAEYVNSLSKQDAHLERQRITEYFETRFGNAATYFTEKDRDTFVKMYYLENWNRIQNQNNQH